MSWAELSFDPRPLIASYVARGGVIHRVPFGVSGLSARRQARDAARAGNLRKYGMPFVPVAARALVIAGRITIAEARIDLVFAALLDGAPTLTDLSATLNMSPHRMRAVVELLERDGYVKREARALRVLATPQRPSWTNYVRAA